MTASAMRDYFNRRYRPENIVLAASGNVDFDGLVAEVEKRSAHWSDRALTPELEPDAPDTVPDGISLDKSIAIDDANQAYVVRIAEGPSLASEDRYASRALASILGDEGSSRLFWELIDTGRAEVATVWPQEFMDTGAWFTYMVCAPEDVAENRQILEKVIGEIVESGVTEEELKQTVNKATAACIMQSERPSNRLFGIGSRWLTQGEYLSTDDTLTMLNGLDVASVSAAAKRYLSKQPVEVIAAADAVASA
jgi:predicted Zn-dependent peptidase